MKVHDSMWYKEGHEDGFEKAIPLPPHIFPDPKDYDDYRIGYADGIKERHQKNEKEPSED